MSVKLLPGMPEAHARALLEAKEHTPLFRLSIGITDLPGGCPIFYQNDPGRGFGKEQTLKVVVRRPAQGATASYAIQVSLADLGSTVTSLEGVTCDGSPLPQISGGVEMQEHKSGPCPVFTATYGWTPFSEPTQKGRRDLLPLELIYCHGLVRTTAEIQVQVKFYDESMKRSSKAKKGMALKCITCRYDGAKKDDQALSFVEVPS